MRAWLVLILVAAAVLCVTVAIDTSVPAERETWQSVLKMVEFVSKSTDCDLRVTGWQWLGTNEDSPSYIAVVKAPSGDAGCLEALELARQRCKALGIGLRIEKRRAGKEPRVPMSYDLIYEVIPSDGT